MRTRSTLFLTLAAALAVCLSASAASAQRASIGYPDYGYTGHYLPTVDTTSRNGIVVNVFDPFLNTKRKIYSLAPVGPGGTVYLLSMNVGNGAIAFVVRQDRYSPHNQVARSTYRVYVWQDGDSQPLELLRKTEINTPNRECGTEIITTQPVSNGGVMAVEQQDPNSLVHNRCLARRTRHPERLLALRAGAPPRVFALPRSLQYIDDGDATYPVIDANPSTDGEYFGGTGKMGIVYVNTSDDAVGSIPNPPGYVLASPLFGPGGRVLAMAYKGKQTRVLYFPSLSSPNHFFDLQRSGYPAGDNDNELFGRFCGTRPVLADFDRFGYSVYDDNGGGTLFDSQPSDFEDGEFEDNSLGCDATSLLVGSFNRRLFTVNSVQIP